METHFKLLKLDETRDWSEDVTSQVDKLYGVYLIDTSEHTYCCELTPSYCAYFLYTTFDADLGELELEALDELIMQGDSDTALVSYFHVGDIKEFAHDFGVDDNDYYDSYDEEVDDMIEHCKGNWYV